MLRLFTVAATLDDLLCNLSRGRHGAASIVRTRTEAGSVPGQAADSVIVTVTRRTRRKMKMRAVKMKMKVKMEVVK